MIVETGIFFVLLFLLAYYKVTGKWKKFQARGIPYASPYFPLGSSHSWHALFAKDGNISEQYRVYLDSPLMKEKIFGVYGHPDGDDCLMINDLDIAKRMLIKDFDHFVDRGNFGLNLDPHDEVDKIFANTFLLMKGDQWKTTRNLISPVFSTGKMKLMFPLIRKVGENMELYLNNESKMNAEIDSQETFFRLALDGIATAGFGLELNTFEEPDSMFVKQVKEIMRAKGSESGSAWEMFKFVLGVNVPSIKKIIDIPNFSRVGCRFLKNIILKTVEMRRSGKAARRNDIIDFVVDEMNKSEAAKVKEDEDDFHKSAQLDMTKVKKIELDKDQVMISNAFILFGAALETTSSSLTFAVHHLLKNPSYQERIREEISKVVGDENEVTFDHIQEMRYLDRFIYEVLRNSHPFGNIIERECTEDYMIPGTNYTVRKGEMVCFSLIYEKMKEENGSFYNAAAFDPDNFAAANNPDSFSFFGFGQGPRNCIGKRYAMMTMKLALVFLLRNFELVKTENTQENLKMTRFTAGANVPFRARRIN